MTPRSQLNMRTAKTSEAETITPGSHRAAANSATTIGA